MTKRSGFAASLAIIALLVVALVGTKRGYVVAASFRYVPAAKPKAPAEQGSAS